MRIVRRRAPFFGALVILLICAVIAGISVGSVHIPLVDILHILASSIPGSRILPLEYTASDRLIILDIRVPVVLMAMLTGIALSSSGASMQGLFRNPLVDPFIIGISAGGAFGWIAASILTREISGIHIDLFRIAVSFLFGMGTVITAYLVARSGSRVPVANLLLAGIALSALLTSATYLLIYFFIDNPSEMIFSLMGTCGNSTWEELYMVVPIVLMGTVVLLVFSRDLNAFSTGEDGAKHLGVEVERSKLIILGAGSLVTAVTIPFCGVIGFVGLIVPHIMRRIIGPDHRFLVPASALAGGIFVILSDLFSRAALDVIIPIGIVTGLIGGGFFIYILIAGRRD
ncbi:MAG: FecCD family ABC transporter permease [Thermoplasmatota archaeon]